MKKVLCLIATALYLVSCSDEQFQPTPTPSVTEKEEPNTNILSDEIKVYNSEKVSNNLVLVNNLRINEMSLIDKKGKEFHKWKLNIRRGNDVVLEPNGKLLALLKANNPKIRFGGYGGRIQVINPDNSVDWDYTHSTEDYILHHDIERLPNGNILAMVWEKKDSIKAFENGFKSKKDIFIESIIEIEPATKNIVWKWSSWDHLVQDHDATKPNYRKSIKNNKELIDINYNSDSKNGDIMHANAIEYDEKNDVILLSVNFYSEIWAIDHSTTKEEAKTNSGGNFNKGGNILYRFGNPTAYKSNETRLFRNNHHCNIINKGLPGAGNVLVFSNGGINGKQSIVYELKLPEKYSTTEKPNVIWSFTSPKLYAGKISGAVRTNNGNTLIAEGDFGYWEVTKDKELVWLYEKSGFYWRGYAYNKNYSGVLNLKP